MGTSSMLKAKGLQTFSNYLSQVPEGSLFKAENVNIDRDGIIEPRRGIKVTADLPDIAKQLLQYKNRVLAHYDDAIAYLSDTDPASITVFQGRSDITMETGSDLLTLTFHGFTIGDIINFTDIDPPSGVFLIGPDYYVVAAPNENQFKISSTPLGAPIVSDADYDATIEYDYVFEEVIANLRIKYIEMNSSLYVTTKDGIKKIAALDPFLVSDAGGINALDVSLALDLGPGSSRSGFFGPLSDAPTDHDVETAYSVVWGTKDVNNVLILGKPSSRSVIANTTGEFLNVEVSFAVPSRINEDYFFQIYRTATALIGGSGAEFKLVYEAPFKVSATEPIDGYEYDPVTNTITVIDQQPEDLRDAGTPLYTNEFSGEGILQANDRPPVAHDIAIYKNSAFYANTRTAFKQEATFVGFDGVEVFNIVGPIVVGAGLATLTTSDPHGMAPGDYFGLAGTSEDGEYIATTGTTGTTLVFPTAALAITQVDGGGTVNKSYFMIKNFDNSIIRRYYLVGRAEHWELTAPTKAATADSSYFHLTTADDKIPYTFWINKSGTATAPSFPDRVLVELDISDAGIITADDVAQIIVDALNATEAFVPDAPAAIIDIDTAESGKVTDVLSGTVGGSFGGTFNPVAHIDGFGEDATLRFVRISSNPSPAVRIDNTARSLVTVINRDELSPVEAFYLSNGTNDLPGAFLLESKEMSLNPFKIQANNQSFGQMFNPDLTNEVSATNNQEGNALYFSKVQQPEAVPIVNKFNIGPRDKQILRIIGLRDSLFILKEEGIYRLSGENSSNFQVALFDNSASITAADSAAVLNNQIYCLTTQGVATVSETGVGIISRPIENLINKITSPLYPNYSTVTFGYSYEADRAYYLHMGENPTDTAATLYYRFNTFTQAWTSGVLNVTCGVVETSKNKQYVGASDIPAVEVERKTLTSRDYADRQYQRQISTVQFGNIYIDSALIVEPGDVLTQTQFLSVPQYNRLIKKLKIDPFLKLSPNILALTLIETNNVSFFTKMNQLVAALNVADPSTVYVYNGNLDFASIQTQYNVIINQMNASTGVFFTDYELSVGTVYFDLLVTSVNKSQNTVRVLNTPPYLIGPVTHYKAIHSDVIWAPIALGNPSISKHIREGTFLLETTSLVGATVGYATDLSGNFETIDHSLDGDGGWGDSIYQNVAWGGEGIAYPIRTLIPRQKQRCRFIKAEFLHQNAFFKFSILGISYTYEEMSERAWK